MQIWAKKRTESSDCERIFGRKTSIKIRIYKTINFAGGSVWVRNMGPNIKGGAWTEGSWEQGAEENIWTEEKWSDGKLKETT
jgi:hypothetical protein